MTAPTPRDIAETLRAAQCVLQSSGWCQGALTDPSGRLCAVGAIQRAVRLAPRPSSDLLAASLSALRPMIEGYHAVPPWNDAPGRTQPEVEKALLQAADRIEVGE